LTKHGTSNAVADASTGNVTFDIDGDRINDSKVLLVKNKLSMLPMAFELDKQTYLTIKQNLFWAFFYNIIPIPFGASGYLTPTWGTAIMGLSDVVLILNSLRLRYKKSN
jgi:Cu+-exporting ATPase